MPFRSWSEWTQPARKAELLCVIADKHHGDYQEKPSQCVMSGFFREMWTNNYFLCRRKRQGRKRGRVSLRPETCGQTGRVARTNFQFFSFALDAATDIRNQAQPAICVRGITAEFDTRENLPSSADKPDIGSEGEGLFWITPAGK